MLDPLLAALIAAAPGVVAWWTGRRLTSHTDDPALPELLLARQQQLLKIAVVAVVLLLFLGRGHAVWGGLLMVVALLAGGYPLHRTLMGDTVSLPRHIWLIGRSLFAGAGFWILLAWTPALVFDAGHEMWWVAIVLLAVLLIWEHWYPQIWLRLHDATPVTDSALLSRLDQIVERAGIAPPALYQVGAPGTRFVNAIALPSLTRPSIGLGNALLELLEPDEAAAIYAHELAHIEHFSPRVIRRLQTVNRVVIVLATTLPVLLLWFTSAPAWIVWVWPLVVLGVLMVRGHKSQQHEHESDLRAAALCGDPEAVVRGLIKVHVHAYIPRRWPVDFERGASHPSLTRRIQALRGQGETAVASLNQATVFPTAREGSLVAFEDARAWWFDGVPADTPHELGALRTKAASLRSVAWPELVELRITATADARALQAVHRNGDRWSVPLDPSQVAAVQKALDVVDVRLRRELGKQPEGGARIAALAVLLMAMVTMPFAGSSLLLVLIPALLVLHRPSVAALGALGVMAVARALHGLVDRPPDLAGIGPTLPLLGLVVAGAIALGLGWRARRHGAPPGTRLTLLVLGGMGALLALAAGPALMSGALPDILPALGITLLGIAGAMLIVEPRRRRVSGGVLATAGIALALVGALPAIGGSDFPQATLTATEVGRLGLGPSAVGLRLSPDGRHFVAQRYDLRGAGRPRDGAAGTWVVGDTMGIRRTVDAWLVDFADDTHLLALRPVEGGLELALEYVDSAAAAWRATVPDLYEPVLTVQPTTGRWAITGEEVSSDSLVVVTGGLTTAEPSIHRFAPLDSMGSVMEPLVFDDGARLLIAGYNVMGGPTSRLSLLLNLFTMRAEVEVWEVSAGGRRHVGTVRGYPQCGQPERERATCVVRERYRSTVWELSPQAVRATATRVPLHELVSMSVGPGPRFMAPDGEGRMIHVDLDANRLTRITLPANPTVRAVEARMAGGMLAAINYEAGGVRLVWYRLDAGDLALQR